MSDEELIQELSILFSKEIEEDNQRYTDTIYDIVVKNKNIIEELEKWLKDNIDYGDDDYYDMKAVGVESALNKLKELKEKKK